MASEGHPLPIGAKGYLDGRDPVAQPPLTIGRINLWESADRERVVAQLKHGARVKIMERHQGADGRWYYCVFKRGTRRGWVSAPFVSLEKHKPLGDLL